MLFMNDFMWIDQLGMHDSVKPPSVFNFLIERRKQLHKGSEIRLLRPSAPLRKGKRRFLFAPVLVSCIHPLLRRVRVLCVQSGALRFFSLQLDIPYTFFLATYSLSPLLCCKICEPAVSINSYGPCQMFNR